MTAPVTLTLGTGASATLSVVVAPLATVAGFVVLA